MRAWMFKLFKMSRRLWLRATLFSLLALLAVALAIWIGPWVPKGLADRFGGDVANSVLSVLSSSMLVIATFSLGTMVSGYTAAANSATPRAASLLAADDYAQNAISTFIGTFLFAVVARIAIDANVFTPGGLTVLFFITLAILASVIATLIRWIDDLSRVGQVRETLAKVEQETRRAIAQRARLPSYGGLAFDRLPAGQDIVASQIGYVQSVDLAELEQLLDTDHWQLYLLAEPGTLVHPETVLARICGSPDELGAALCTGLRGCFTVGDSRTTLQDSRFGLSVLAEAASRALSPGVNDPGTAIDVVVTAGRCIDYWYQQASACDQTVHRPWLYANPLPVEELLECAFYPVIRYGAAEVDVMRSLLTVLDGIASLDESGHRAAREFYNELLERASNEIHYASDRARLDKAQQRLITIKA